LETNQFQHHPSWWLQQEPLLRAHCKMPIAPGPIVNQTVLPVYRTTHTPHL
jgi:hypothetical protein